MVANCDSLGVLSAFAVPSGFIALITVGESEDSLALRSTFIQTGVWSFNAACR